ncbi:hypothetical protein CVT26_015517 [Gymnopilus dilepis]|uniref:DUF6589 domain-containing protein n=1 Tax=Gymnopilus dilepis TaxID=231916 RepID=A0A409YD10_9AGAR|nr:hypothetical protein CVT26_015517 [Gymnopilus dilepis]
MTTARKRPPNDENLPPGTFIQYPGPQQPSKPPSVKRVRRTVLKNVTPAQMEEARVLWLEKQKERVEEQVLKQKDVEEAKEAEAAERLRRMEAARVEVGYPTLFAFLSDLLSTKDRAMSSQVSQMISHHGNDLLDSLHARRPEEIDKWMAKRLKTLLMKEGLELEQVLQPDRTKDVTLVLEQFSVSALLDDARRVAPQSYSMLSSLSGHSEDATEGRKKKDIIITTVMCILAQARNEKASEFQLVIAIYLLASGASRSLFNVLNHAGLCLSYSSAMDKIRAMGRERQAKMRRLVRSNTCMVIWDNINIAFRVNEQRQTSKNHFDNGTTATLIPLFDVPFGSLPLSVLPPRETRRHTFNIEPHKDLLPTGQQIMELQTIMLWHIRDIFLSAYPQIRLRFKDLNLDPPSVLSIPVHKTEQYPLPAALIDESTIDGTLDVINHIFFRTLELTEDDIKKHGPFLSAGDQLTNALTDSASASRRDDKSLVDSPGKFLKPQIGLFHAKVAGARCTANEHWGVPNSKSPWSLWRMNTLLGRKAIIAGWKAKQLPPFRPIMELMLQLTLPANILDGFRLYCPGGDLDKWAAKLRSYEELVNVSQAVFENLFSARRVTKLRQLAKRDVPLENIILFNRDALILLALTAAVKRGDVGTVINVLGHWMVMFRGTSKMPKYADALFHTLMDLKAMDPGVRHAYLMNWLANLSGKINGFKEMDLLQEHQNFWLKIIYNAKGSNRSWEWLAMVSVSIFALREVIRQVQTNFQTPHNSNSHTSPSTKSDQKVVRDYLKEQDIQTYTPDRLNNEWATPVRDLMVEGATYATGASAYKNFRPDTRKASFAPSKSSPTASTADADESDPCDFRENVDLDVGDLTLDEEEFPGEFDPDSLPTIYACLGLLNLVADLVPDVAGHPRAPVLLPDLGLLDLGHLFAHHLPLP